MRIEEFLHKRKESILKKWFHHVVKTYPDETAKFLVREKDPFNNPVGSNIFAGLEEVFDRLVSGEEVTAVTPFLERMIKIRAIQDFTPSQAVTFAFVLKAIVREELAKEGEAGSRPEQAQAFEDKIDRLALIAFDAYVQAREKVYQMRVDEVKRRVSNLLKRANLTSDIVEENNESEEEHH